MRIGMMRGLLGAAALVAAGCSDRGDAPRSGQDSGTAPEIRATAWLNTPGGKPVTLKELRGQVVVVEFWATWCPPCRTSIPHLVDIYNRNKDRGLAVVALTNEPKVDAIRTFAEKMKMPYYVGVGSDTGAAYGVRGIPHAAIVGKSGQIVWSGHPMDQQFAPAVEAQLATK